MEGTKDVVSMSHLLQYLCFQNDSSSAVLAMVQPVIQRHRQLHQQERRLSDITQVSTLEGSSVPCILC